MFGLQLNFTRFYGFKQGKVTMVCEFFEGGKTGKNERELSTKFKNNFLILYHNYFSNLFEYSKIV